MAITDPVVLSADVVLAPVADLPEEVRRLLDCAADDWALTHPRARTPSRLVDARTADLLREFREPRTIVEAVVRFSRAREADPETTLEEAYPFLERLLAAGFLVEEGAADAAGIRPTFVSGDEVAGFTILDSVQALEDTEVYQARAPGGARAALKIERPVPLAPDDVLDDEAPAASALEREASVLAHLDGTAAPRLLAAGRFGARHFLAMEWLSGIDAGMAAAELRRGPRSDLLGLLDLCRAIAGAYARLHERGVVHGDVHPRNILVSAAGDVRLVDFGLAHWAAAPSSFSRPPRGGIAFFYEPEYARAFLAGRRAPRASRTGEQFAVAALLYFLLTGAHRRDFPLERSAMLRAIAELPPLPFTERGADPWPALESVLARALDLSPRHRHRSLAHLHRALSAIPPDILLGGGPGRGGSGPAQATGSGGGREGASAHEGAETDRSPHGPAGDLLTRWLERVALDGPLWSSPLPPPRASIHSGAAGIAAALYRIAIAFEDPARLALADLWAARAAAERGEEAFYAPHREITPEIAGRVSPFHTATGPLCLQALIAHVRGDAAAQHDATARFLAAAHHPCDNLDLTLGRAGVLLAAALLLEAARTAGLDTLPLRGLGGDLLAGLWRELDPLPPIDVAAEHRNLGMAHGWAGYLYASLRWCRAAGVPRPPHLSRRLTELAYLAIARGRGLCWRWRDGEEDGELRTMPGWCNGSAGFVPLWVLAARELGDSPWRELAEGAAWNVWEAPDSSASLCCGLAGRGYALLHLYRHLDRDDRDGGGHEWLDRARALADRAAREIEATSDAPDSLHRGLPGVAALAADLTRPETAAFPFFDEEGWPAL